MFQIRYTLEDGTFAYHDFDGEPSTIIEDINPLPKSECDIIIRILGEMNIKAEIIPFNEVKP
jgi:hypothetical protein